MSSGAFAEIIFTGRPSMIKHSFSTFFIVSFKLVFNVVKSSINLELKEVLDSLDDKYPQGRINLQEGTVQYQPGAPTRKQLAEQQGGLA